MTVRLMTHIIQGTRQQLTFRKKDVDHDLTRAQAFTIGQLLAEFNQMPCDITFVGSGVTMTCNPDPKPTTTADVRPWTIIHDSINIPENIVWTKELVDLFNEDCRRLGIGLSLAYGENSKDAWVNHPAHYKTEFVPDGVVVSSPPEKTVPKWFAREHDRAVKADKSKVSPSPIADLNEKLHRLGAGYDAGRYFHEMEQITRSVPEPPHEGAPMPEGIFTPAPVDNPVYGTPPLTDAMRWYRKAIALNGPGFITPASLVSMNAADGTPLQAHQAYSETNPGRDNDIDREFFKPSPDLERKRQRGLNSVWAGVSSTSAEMAKIREEWRELGVVSLSDSVKILSQGMGFERLVIPKFACLQRVRFTDSGTLGTIEAVQTYKKDDKQRIQYYVDFEFGSSFYDEEILELADPANPYDIRECLDDYKSDRLRMLALWSKWFCVSCRKKLPKQAEDFQGGYILPMCDDPACRAKLGREIEWSPSDVKPATSSDPSPANSESANDTPLSSAPPSTSEPSDQTTP